MELSPKLNRGKKKGRVFESNQSKLKQSKKNDSETTRSNKQSGTRDGRHWKEERDGEQSNTLREKTEAINEGTYY